MHTVLFLRDVMFCFLLVFPHSERGHSDFNNDCFVCVGKNATIQHVETPGLIHVLLLGGTVSRMQDKLQ